MQVFLIINKKVILFFISNYFFQEEYFQNNKFVKDLMKNCFVFLEYSDEPPKCLPYRLPNKKSPLKSNNLRDLQLSPSYETDKSLIKHYSESRLLTAIDFNISHLRNTCKDRKKIKDAVMVRKIDLVKKQNQDLRKTPLFPPPSLLHQSLQFQSNYSDLQKRNRMSVIAPHPFLRRNQTESNLTPQSKKPLKPFIPGRNVKSTSKVTKDRRQLQALKKRESEPQTIFQKNQKSVILFPTKTDTIINLKLSNYLNFIRQARKLHKFVEEFPKLPALTKKKNLRVKIKKGNNSLLVKEMFKKRWWWTIDEQKESKQKHHFVWSQLKDKNYFKQELEEEDQIYSHNHFWQNQYLGNKKALFYNMRHFYEEKGSNVFDFLPLTFHVQEIGDEAWKNFTKKYKQNESQTSSNIWILKPGENSNRGKGITVHNSYEDIRSIIQEGGTFTDAIDNKVKKRTFIIQSYIDKPFLYNKRKFDIRCYMLLVNINGSLKGYWYKEGYIRTSSFEFQLTNFNTFVHLTNDAIQNNSEFYGKYEDGNKVSYSQFQKYLDTKHSGAGFDFEAQILPKIKNITLDSILASRHLVKGNCKKPVFEVFGLDFMIDESFQPWLIEINTNPCIETSCLVLQKIIPRMLDDAFKLSLDVLFPPPEHWPSSRRHYIPSGSTGFELIFQEQKYEEGWQNLEYLPSLGQITQDDEVYEQR